MVEVSGNSPYTLLNYPFRVALHSRRVLTGVEVHRGLEFDDS